MRIGRLVQSTSWGRSNRPDHTENTLSISMRRSFSLPLLTSQSSVTHIVVHGMCCCVTSQCPSACFSGNWLDGLDSKTLVKYGGGRVVRLLFELDQPRRVL